MELPDPRPGLLHGRKRPYPGERDRYLGGSDCYMGGKNRFTGGRACPKGERKRYLGESDCHLGDRDCYLGERIRHMGESDLHLGERGPDQALSEMTVSYPRHRSHRMPWLLVHILQLQRRVGGTGHDDDPESGNEIYATKVQFRVALPSQILSYAPHTELVLQRAPSPRVASQAQVLTRTGDMLR